MARGNRRRVRCARGWRPTAAPRRRRRRPEAARRSRSWTTATRANRASANIGDHIQTIAALGHLVRHQNVRLHGPDELTQLLADLKQRTRPELQRTGIDADLEVMTVHRDASAYEAIPEETWVLCFGWYMHALFRMRHGFPLHRNLRPMFVSFHCNKREPADAGGRRVPAPLRAGRLPRLDDRVPAALVRRAGVLLGLRDDDDRRRLPDLRRRPPAGAPPAYVDVPKGERPPDAVTYRHSRARAAAAIRRQRASSARPAGDLSPKRRSGLTSRLHCYLPVRSLGARLEFRPAEPLRHPLRRADRHRRPCVRGDPGRHARAARAHPRRDRAGAPGGGRSTRCGASSAPPTSLPPSDGGAAAQAAPRPQHRRGPAQGADRDDHESGRGARRRRRCTSR